MITYINFVFTVFIIICGLDSSQQFRLKFTKVECDTPNKSEVIFETCKVKAVSRNLQYISLNVTFRELPLYDINGTVAFFKRANGYKPFLYSFELNCETVKRLNPVTKLVWQWFQDNSNIGRLCPFETNFLIPRLENVYLEKSMLQLPVPGGDYACFTTWLLNNKTQLSVKVYGTIS
uniref:MD-2-related lipid-recognition domain-containing protein n=1 Tax=Musca domestica TaxID=7370 RepID=A0A1I8MYM0_MUSDO